MSINLIHPRTGALALGIRKSGAPIWPVAGADGRAEGGTITAASPMLQRLYDERNECIAFADKTIAGANVEGQTRDLSDTEDETLTRARERITKLDKQIKPLEEYEQMRSAGNSAAQNYLRPTAPGTPSASNGLGARTDPVKHVYRSRGHVMVDHLRAIGSGESGPVRPDPEARDRLISAGAIFEGVNEEDFARAETAQTRALADWMTQERALVSQVTADTPGILPVPIVGEIMSDVDGARPFITSVGAKALSFKGKTFSRPVITQHTAAGKQTTEGTNTGIGSQKLIISGVPFAKEVWGAALDVSRQEIDWTEPAAWDAILTDMDEQYGLQTENAAADTFATAVVQTTEVPGTVPADATLRQWLTALYAAAALAYAGGGRLPDTIWVSLDMWGQIGPVIESQVSTNKTPGSSSLSTFSGMLADLPRIVVPSFAAGTVIIGVKRWTEVYEERIGLLQAVKPAAFGVEIALGGYVAYNTLKPTAFAKVTNTVAA